MLDRALAWTGLVEEENDNVSIATIEDDTDAGMKPAEVAVAFLEGVAIGVTICAGVGC